MQFCITNASGSATDMGERSTGIYGITRVAEGAPKAISEEASIASHGHNQAAAIVVS